MISKKATFFILLCVLIVVSPLMFSQTSNYGDQFMQQTISLYKNGLYAQAVAGFKGILNDPKLSAYHGEAYFWISKSYLAIGNVTKAATYLEYFLSNYRNSPYFIEAYYQKGRLLFLTNDFENAIIVFKDFIERYPSSPYIANAYFWVGECLYNLGKLDDALVLYKNVVQNYPNSYKYEAANYRMSIIEFKKRENELLKLLKWSHLEALKNYDEFKQRETVYEQAIATYQKKLSYLEAGNLSIDSSQYSSELDAKNDEIFRLKQDLEKCAKELYEYKQGKPSGDEETSQEEAMAIKNDALEVQKLLLQLLEQKMENTQ